MIDFASCTVTELKRDQTRPPSYNTCRLEFASNDGATVAPKTWFVLWLEHTQKDNATAASVEGTFNECKLTVLHFKLAIKCNDYINIHTAVADASKK